MSGVAKYPAPPAWADGMTTVGVTGTNGKTSTCLLLGAALSGDGPTPPVLTTLGLLLDGETTAVKKHRDLLDGLERAFRRGERRAVLEMTSLALARGAASAWPITGAIFTGLSHDHLDVHVTPEHYLASKAQLFVHLRKGGFAILNADDPVSALLEEVIPEGVRILRYGRDRRADAAIREIDISWTGTTVHLADGTELTTPLIGEHFAANAVAAWLAAVALGVAPRQAARGLAGMEAGFIPGRFERVARSPNVVIDFAHSPEAMVKTVQTARALAPNGRITVVFGSAGGTDPGHRPALARAASMADRVLVTTDNPRDEDPATIAAELLGATDHPNATIVLDRRAAIAVAIAGARADDVVILAGKGHETEQVIGTQRQPFAERAIVRELLGSLQYRGTSVPLRRTSSRGT